MTIGSDFGSPQNPQNHMFYLFCPYCGSDDVRRAISGAVNSAEHNINSVQANAGLPGLGIRGELEDGREFTRTTEYYVRYSCSNCGRDFDNSTFLKIFERDFEPTYILVDKYKLITGYNSLSALREAIEGAQIARSRKFRHMEVDSPKMFKIRIDGRNLRILLRKTMTNDGRIVFLMEDITGGN